MSVLKVVMPEKIPQRTLGPFRARALEGLPDGGDRGSRAARGRLRDRAPARWSRSWARRARASRRCSTSSARSTGPPRAATSSTASRSRASTSTSCRRCATARSASSSSRSTCCRATPRSRTSSCRWSTPASGAARGARRRCAALERVGLGERVDHLPNQLSGGQQQRVSIARAIVNEPLLLLADEPTGALDSATTGQVMELFRELHRQGMTVVLVTHDPNIAAVRRARGARSRTASSSPTRPRTSDPDADRDGSRSSLARWLLAAVADDAAPRRADAAPTRWSWRCSVDPRDRRGAHRRGPRQAARCCARSSIACS